MDLEAAFFLDVDGVLVTKRLEYAVNVPAVHIATEQGAKLR